MADEGLRIVNTVDNTQVEKAFSSVRKQIINSADTAQQQGHKIDKAFDNIAVSANATSDTIKKRLIEVQNSVNSLSAQIIAKRAVIRDIQDDVKTLSEAYKKAVKNGSSNKNSILGDLNAAKRQLSEEKYALGLLNDEKAKATLRTKELKAQLEMSKKTVDDNTLSVNMLTKAFAALGGTIMLKNFISQVVQTRGEFQQLEVAFKTMLGSAEKASDLMQQLTKTAAITPFDLKGVTDGAKQLLAYGVKAEEVNDVLIHLGDIAAGLSLPLGDLVYLYGTTLTQGRMYTQDLRQFMGRGIPLAEELAKQFGVTKDKVGELVTAGKVGADEFKKAIMSMSSEGGKFGGLMEAQSKTITGQISNIEDAIDVMFNNIGQKSEGIINKSLGVVSSLVENYENVGKTILSVIAVYGTYKAAVMTVCAIQKLQAAGIAALTVSESIHYGWLVLMEKAQLLLNKTMLANPYVLAATALVALIVVMSRATDESRVMTQATEAYNAAKEKAIENEQKHAEEMNKLIDVATDESNSTDNRIKALNRLEQEYPAIFSKYDTEAEKLEHIRDIKKEIAEYDASTSMSNVNYELETVNAQIDALEKKGVGQYETTFMYGTPQRRWMGGRTDQEEAQLQFLMTKRAELEGLVKKDNAENYLANLTGVSDEELAQEIQVRKDLLAEITLTGNKSGKVASGGAQGEYSADELKGQMQIFQSEQNRRNEKRYSPSEIKNNLAKELAAAKKALADFDKSSTKLTIAEAEKERKRLQDAVSDAEKKYKAAGGNDTKDAKDATSKAKYDETRRKQELAEKRAAEDMELSTRQAVINARENSTEKILEQYDLDFEKQKLAIERGYEDLKQKKIDNARSLFEANPANKGKVFDESSVDTSYTAEETANYQAMLAANEQAHKQNIDNFHKEEQTALYQYLKEYGDYEQKRLSIAKEYEQRIKDAKTQGEKMSLQRQMESELKELDMNEFKNDVNWEVIFNDLDRVSVKTLTDLKGRLKEALDAKDISAENAKVIAEQIDRINSAIDTKQKEWLNAFGLVIPELQKQKRLKQEEIEAQNRLTQAVKKQAEAEREVAEAREEIVRYAGQEGVSVSSSDVSTANQNSIFAMFQNAGKDTSKLADMFSKLGKAESGATESTEALAGAQAEAGAAAEGAAGSAAGTIAIIDTIIHKINENVQSANELFAQLGLSDTKFGKGFNKFAESSQYATEGWEALKSGNVMGVANGVVGSLRTLGEALGEIGIGFMGNSDTELPDVIERNTVANKDLERAVNNLSEKMDKSAVVDAGDIYKEQVAKINQSIANTQENMIRSGAAYSNGFLGLFGTHSSDYQIDENISSDEWKRISDLLGKNIRSAGDFFSLTSEEMYKVQTELTDIYSRIKLYADDGYRDAAVYMDEYCEYWKQLQELENQYFEKLTSTSFDTIKNDFANMLMDMDSDTKDFSKNFEKYMQAAIVNSISSKNYEPLLQEWYNAFASFMNDGTIDESELEALRKGGSYTNLTTGKSSQFIGWNQLTENALAERDALKKVFNWSDSFEQEASSKGFNAMNQEMGAEMNGRLTAIQIVGYELRDLAAVRNEMIARMEQQNGNIKTSVDAITDAMATANIHLSDIAKYSKNLIGIGDKLDTIIDNTKHL